MDTRMQKVEKKTERPRQSVAAPRRRPAQKNSINPAAGENEVFFLGFVTVSLLHE